MAASHDYAFSKMGLPYSATQSTAEAVLPGQGDRSSSRHFSLSNASTWPGCTTTQPPVEPRLDTLNDYAGPGSREVLNTTTTHRNTSTTLSYIRHFNPLQRARHVGNTTAH